MDDPQYQLVSEQELNTPAQRLASHLSYYPCDLIDVRRLLRRFQASGADFQQAMRQIEHLESTSDRRAT